MDSNNSDELGKQPPGSIKNVFSSFFSRDISASSVTDSAILTSFKELPDVEDLLPEGGQTINSENKLQGRKDMHQDNMTALGQWDESSETHKESDNQVKTAAGASVDPDVVQVTRVETYSDTENEYEEAANNSTGLSEKITRTSRPSLPDEDNYTGDHVDGDKLKDSSKAEAEYQMPVFRTHNLKEKSRIEAILYSDRLTSRTKSRTALISSVSKHGHGCSPKENTTTLSVDVETCAASEKSSDNVGMDEEKYAGIDCSLPTSSIISGHLDLEAAGQNAAIAFPLKHTGHRDSTQKEETCEERAETDEGTEESYSSQVSSSVPSSPKTPEVAVQAGITNYAIGFKKPTPLSTKTPERNTPPPVSSISPSSTSSTSSPSRGTSLSSPPSFQMPALFSGLRVLKKGAVGDDRETMSEIKQREKDADLALLSLKKTVNKAKLFPEQKTATPVKKHAEPKTIAETKSTVMGQLSQLLNLDNQDETKKDADPEHSKKESGEEVVGETIPGPGTLTSPPEKKKTSDLAYETFRNIFGPKTVKIEKTEKVDLEAVKKKIKNDKENLRSIFERTSKSPGKELKSPTEANTEVTSPTDSEDRTPGRLQAVWPPPKPKDEEEKVGLKYTEAEHQAALLQLKRECKEEVERMHLTLLNTRWH
ncbi:formin-1-like [Micropterus salmoides]|uniref:formin-1-like n=1 Tax=Micropterus salmoides TaxID=27706 RepID=UPI0018EE465D|nr:formin-1-like [Micropterus salmoides]